MNKKPRRPFHPKDSIYETLPSVHQSPPQPEGPNTGAWSDGPSSIEEWAAGAREAAERIASMGGPSRPPSSGVALISTMGRLAAEEEVNARMFGAPSRPGTSASRQGLTLERTKVKGHAYPTHV